MRCQALDLLERAVERRLRLGREPGVDDDVIVLPALEEVGEDLPRSATGSAASRSKACARSVMLAAL